MRPASSGGTAQADRSAALRYPTQPASPAPLAPSSIDLQRSRPSLQPHIDTMGIAYSYNTNLALFVLATLLWSMTQVAKAQEEEPEA